MRIVDAKVIVCCPGRNFVTLKLVTEDGVYGLGDATLNGRELAVASYLTDHLVPLLIGRDARRIEDTWQYLYKGAYWRRGPGDDGGDCRRRHRAVGHRRQDAERAGLSAARRRVARPGAGLRARQRQDARRHRRGRRAIIRRSDTRRSARSAAFRASSTPTGSPRVTSRTSRRRRASRPKPSGAPKRYLSFVPSVFERLRREFGSELHLLHDVHHRLTPIEAGRLGQALEPYRLFWMEDPVPAEAAGVLPAHPPAHDDADRGRRGVQLDLRLPPAHPGAVDRLHPDDGDACRRASATCARLPRSRSCTTCAPARTAPPI